MTTAAPAFTTTTIDLSGPRPTTMRRAVKAYAVLEAVVATLILMAAAPVLISVAIAMKLDGGPVFRTTRVGHNGREFQ